MKRYFSGWERMSTRFNLLLCAALATAAMAQDAFLLDLFDGRDLKGHPGPAVPSAVAGSGTAAVYKKILPERSLLLWDCEPGSFWCGDPAFQFKSIFSKAATLAGYSNPDDAAKAWYTSASQDQSGTFANQVVSWPDPHRLDTAPFQLLAIVNRMDLATGDGTTWKGPEIHFVYGLRGATQFTLILEFALPDFSWTDFQKLAGSWLKLSTDTVDKPIDLLNQALLASRLDNSGFVRLRMNRGTAGGAWELSQWNFQVKGSLTLAPTLDDQINLAILAARLKDAWPTQPPSADTLDISIPAGLQAPPRMKYTLLETGMQTPQGLCTTEPDTTRNILAIQQCSFCHNIETGATFQHIANPQSGSSAVLSAFLTGGTPTLPTVESLYFATNNAGYSSAKFNYQKYGGQNCGQLQSQPIERKFNDLARRALFLAAVIAAKQGAKGRNIGLGLIRSFSTGLAH